MSEKNTPKTQSVCKNCGKAKNSFAHLPIKGQSQFDHHEFEPVSEGAQELLKAVFALRAARPSEPSAPQPATPAEWRRQESCSECDGDGCANCAPQTSAEPQHEKPFSCPIEIQCDHAERCLDKCQEGFVGFSMSPAAPQPVSGDAPEWKKLPVGHWFFLDSPVCTNRYSVQERTDSGCTLVCSTPWHHDGAKADMQRIADLHNSQEADPAPSPTPSVSTTQEGLLKIADEIEQWAKARQKTLPSRGDWK